VARAGRRIALLTLALVAGALAAPAGIADPIAQLESIDEKVERLRERIEEARQREQVLTTDIAAASERIEAVAGEVEVLGTRLETIEAELARHRGRLMELRELYARETRRLGLAVETERLARERLERRVVDLYTNEPPDEIEILFLVRNLDDLLDQLEYLDQIAQRDQAIAGQVAVARARIAESRRTIAAAKAEEAETTRLIAARAAEQRAAYERLVAYRDELVSAQADRRALLAAVRGSRDEAEEDLERLEQASAELTARLQAAAPASAGPPPAPSASGFIWPVDGPITSGYGMRWGRLHAGIDIGAGFGTPIRAAAAGTVTYAGWLGGYGNLIVVDHGGGLSTAYAHQQRIYVGVGASVAQGEVLGEVGSTGCSFGPHLHFEVRVNGTAVDPLGYL
jgi:murein DD-endopeptidase MepM/ murein hydrolase activator NlpD